ncbi:MAG TPA: hypothetical protein VFQ79_14320 [Bryobacteraceae bacterium]|nr:hypothetical protein [Bryobacteraceae bacterium]
MPSYARAILWAQWRVLRNSVSRGRGVRMYLVAAVAVLWYGMWALAAASIAILLSAPSPAFDLAVVLSNGLLLATVYWQAAPLLMASTGASLDISRLLVYPIPRRELFLLELVLRALTGFEVLLLIAGAAVGLFLNPRIAWWTSLALALYVAFNLFLSAGLKSALVRFTAKRRIRELVVLVMMLVVALPQYILWKGVPEPLRRQFEETHSVALPWAAAGRLAAGEVSVPAWLSLLGWIVAAFFFGRRQFEGGLRSQAGTAARRVHASRMDALSRTVFDLCSHFLRDPTGALVEKELRTLARAPRFRLVFVMGFSFGLLIWIPMLFGGRHAQDSFLTQHYLTLVCLYALLLVGEVLFWNSLGFDRAAVQLYYVTPVRPRAVLLAKNIVAAVIVLLEATAVVVVCMALRFPASASTIAEAYAVTLVYSVFLMADGNISATRHARPMNPEHSWRSSSGSRGALLLVFYPLLFVPVSLAFAARFAFASETAFWVVLFLIAVFAGIVYRIALESGVGALQRNRERLIASLSHSPGLIAGG